MIYTAYLETRITGEYLVLGLQERQEVLYYQLEMLRLNPHPGILSVEKRQADGKQELCYMLQDNISLKTHLLNRLKINKVLQILENILHILNNCRNHLLYSCCFLLETKYIYINPQTGSVVLTYLPLCPQHAIGASLEKFLEQFIREVNLENDEEIVILKKIENFRNMPEFSITGVLELIKDLRISFLGDLRSQQQIKVLEKPFRLNTKKTDNALELNKSYFYLKRRFILHWLLFILFVLSLTGLLYRYIFVNRPLTFGSIVVLLAASSVLIIKRYCSYKQVRTEIKNNHEWQENIKLKLANEQGILKQEICRHKIP